MASAHHPKLVFDGTCAFCTAGVRRLARLARASFDFIPSQTDQAKAILPGVGDADFQRQVYLVHGRHVYGGAEAVARALMINPWLRPLAALYYLPGLRQLADAAYRWVAARRHCLGGRCELPR
jgi:predicted DCC family thiol-disulfide oxidoreductase YuxK